MLEFNYFRLNYGTELIFAPMKWFVYLFSLYILLLSGIPCEANDDCCMDEIDQTTSQKKQKETSDKSDCPCSPFFACNACHGAEVPNTLFEFSKTVPPVTKPKYYNKVQPLFDFSSSIWQPPKMA